MKITLKPTSKDLARCASRRIGHTWNKPENQHWEQAEAVKVGRRTMRRIRCVSTCDRCGSSRVEPFLVDTRDHLAGRDGRWYRQSAEYRARDRMSTEELVWHTIPAEVLAALRD